MKIPYRAMLYLAAACSGAASLIFEIVWIRNLGLSFGSTLLSLSLVTAVFFLGLALGAEFAARFISDTDNPLYIYAFLEIFVGLWSIGAFFLLGNAHHLYALFPYLPVIGQVSLKIFASMAILFPATIAMGASLPLLVSVELNHERTGLRTASLYAANTFGAVIGVLLTGLVFIYALNLLGSTLVGTLFEIVAAGIALFLHRVWKTKRTKTITTDLDFTLSPNANGNPQASARTLVATAAIGGLAGASLEMIFFRSLHIILMGTIETISVVLAAFLLGLALGSLAYRVIGHKTTQPSTNISYILIGFITVMLGSATLFPWLAYTTQSLAESGGLWSAVQRFFYASIVLIPVAALSGALLPAIVDGFQKEQNISKMARVLAANTFGAVSGSLLSGLVLLPYLGSTASLFLIALMLIGVIVLHSISTHKRFPLVISLIALIYATFLWPGLDVSKLALFRQVSPESSFCHAKDKVDVLVKKRVFHAEGGHGVVNLLENSEKEWTLSIDGLIQASRRNTSPRFSPESVLLAAIPAALSQEQNRALVIGLGAGITAETLLAMNVHHVVVVELEEKVVLALDHINDGHRPIRTDPRVELLLDDGRDYLQRLTYEDKPQKFDIITSQPSHWWLSGVGNLATDEFYGLAYKALTPGGIFFQWINSHRMTPEVLQGISASMQRNFDYIVLFGGQSPGLYYLAGFRTGAAIDPQMATRRLAYLQNNDYAIKEKNADDLAALALMWDSRAPRLDAPANRDRDALVETRLARVSSSMLLNINTLNANFMRHSKPPFTLFNIDNERKSAILLQSAELRLGSPKGWPTHYTKTLELDVVFPLADKNLANYVVQQALPDLGECTQHYLRARLLLLDGKIQDGIQTLLSTCPSEPSNKIRQRALKIAALLQIELYHCAQAAKTLEQVLDMDAIFHLLKGMNSECLGTSPKEDYLLSLHNWTRQSLPGAAMRWASQHQHDVPQKLFKRAVNFSSDDPDVMQALLSGNIAAQISPELKARAGRHFAEIIDKKLDNLQKQARKQSSKNHIGERAAIFRKAASLAPSNVSIAIARIKFLLLNKRFSEAKQAEQTFIQASDAPNEAQKRLRAALLHPAK